MQRSYLCLTVLILCLVSIEAAADDTPEPNEPAVHYVIAEPGAVYDSPRSSSPRLVVGFRDRVEVLQKGPTWSQVRTPSGEVGYMQTSALSNIWLRVSKSHGNVYVYRGSKLIRTMAADFGYNVTDDKIKQGSREEPDHWRTPEGQFYITNKNPDSQYYKALVLNYPTPEDARRGLKQGLISESEHMEIVRASMRYERPPMDTALGGWIEIHGEGTGGRINWTHGCVAVKNSQLDAIWDLVSRGTPVIIE